MILAHHSGLLTFPGLADHELRGLRGVRGPSLVDGPHAELVLLPLGEALHREEFLWTVGLADLNKNRNK